MIGGKERVRVPVRFAACDQDSVSAYWVTTVHIYKYFVLIHKNWIGNRVYNIQSFYLIN